MEIKVPKPKVSKPGVEVKRPETDLKFLKPDRIKIVLFIVLIFVMYYALLDVRIFPCKKGPEMADISYYTDGWCGLAPEMGIRQILGPIGIVEVIVIVFIIPYIIACLLAGVFKKKKKPPEVPKPVEEIAKEGAKKVEKAPKPDEEEAPPAEKSEEEEG